MEISRRTVLIAMIKALAQDQSNSLTSPELDGVGFRKIKLGIKRNFSKEESKKFANVMADLFVTVSSKQRRTKEFLI